MVPCEPHLVVTAAPTIRRSERTAAARAEHANHLPKLRGLRNTEVRMEIAGFLGVRSARDVVGGGASGGGGGGGGGRLR